MEAFEVPGNSRKIANLEGFCSKIYTLICSVAMNKGGSLKTIPFVSENLSKTFFLISLLNPISPTIPELSVVRLGNCNDSMSQRM